MALIHDLHPYQQVHSLEVSPSNYQPVTDEYGNAYAEFDFSDHSSGETITVQIDYGMSVNELLYDVSTCEGPLPDDYTQPELHIESMNPQIVTLAREMSRNQETVCEQVRTFYDYVGSELVYSFNGRDWGAQAALGPMGRSSIYRETYFVHHTPEHIIVTMGLTRQCCGAATIGRTSTGPERAPIYG